MKIRPNRNVRNNNPLNIRESADWVGERSVNLDKEFEEFQSPEFGFRAAYIILLRYLERGDNSIAAIIAKWAPSSENHTDDYIAYIADKMGLSPVDQLLPSDLPLLMVHMANYEGAKGAYTYDQALAGRNLAHNETFVLARIDRITGGYA
ncbi:hypothetical protein [Thalassotalea euphylliae]|uniref:hypothetical protein n=1 Tax=Thalassotalea euphylliae TaxID=1655234 RepID=UPI0015F27A61|nr:hypothetical protein [Thalassotalea euphylliae]